MTKFWHKFMSSVLVIHGLSFLYSQKLNLWIPQEVFFVFGFHLRIFVGGQILVFDVNQCNLKCDAWDGSGLILDLSKTILLIGKAC